MGLLTDFYNTVARFFRPQEETGDEASKSVATNRLKLVLMQDRTNLTPKILEQMRGELVDLLSKYLEMDKELLELNFEQEGDQVALMLSIPVIRAKDEEEIELALAEAAEKKVEETVQAEKTEEDSAEEDVTEEAETEETEAATESETSIDTEGTEVVAERETSIKTEEAVEQFTETDSGNHVTKPKSNKKKEDIPESSNV